MMKDVILDTDIGGDIDDTWALGVLLKSPELNLKAITTVTGDTVYRAALCAKIVRVSGRAPVPVGTGPKGKGPFHYNQGGWLDDPLPEEDRKCFHPDAVQLIIDMVNAASEPVTLLEIGPLSNLAELVRRSPETAEKINLIAMGGSVWQGYFGKAGRCSEYNIQADIPSARTVFGASWHSFMLSPLDNCGDIYLRGEYYQRVYKSADPVCRMICENDTAWRTGRGVQPWDMPRDPEKESTLLCDTGVIALAIQPELAEIRTLPLTVNDVGETVEDEHGRMIQVALDWHDRDAFYRFLTERLAGKSFF